jgi:very-short-patch-repair endonuclease
MKLEISCSSCGNNFLKESKEIKRRQKECGEDVSFYCSLKCQGDVRRVIKVAVSKICQCGSSFETTTDASYCGLRCASLFSLTKERLDKMLAASKHTRFTRDNLDTVSNGLRVREWSKYDLLHQYLLTCAISHSFEYCLENTRWIFDLAIHDLCLLIEFDEKHHDYTVERDSEKERAANEQGWNLVRIDVRSATIPYSVDLISYLLVNYE